MNNLHEKYDGVKKEVKTLKVPSSINEAGFDNKVDI